MGLAKIKYLLGRERVYTSGCDHWDSGQDFYYHLEKEIGELFIRKPCLELGDLFGVFDEIPDPPTGCRLAGGYGGGDDDDDTLSCPLAPIAIRRHLKKLATELKSLNHDLLKGAF